MYNRQIKTFIYVTDSGSFTKAAELLYTTPASVMNQMNALEERIGVRLLARDNRGIELTPAGKSFYRSAVQIIKISDSAVRKLRETAGTERHTIRVGTSLLNPCKALIDLWGKIDDSQSKRFQIKIVPFEDDHTNILSVFSMLGKKFDLLVGANSSKEWLSRCNFYPLGQYDIYCAVSRKHKFAAKKSLSLKDLSNQNLMMGKRGDSDIIDSIRDMLEKKYPSVNIIDTPYFYDAEVFNACEQSDSVLLTLSAWKDVHPSLITVPVKWNYKIPYGLMCSKNPSPPVNKFLQVIQPSEQIP